MDVTSDKQPPTLQATQPHRPELDVSRVPADDGAPRPIHRLTGARPAGFCVLIQRSVLNALHSHGDADTSVEICGVLVGRVRHDAISTYLHVMGLVPGDKAANKQTQVTFTAATWDVVQKRMETDFPEEKVVGWYHTHPGFGVFLSGMDLFIQDNFFNLPWQIAWVYDPIARTDGVFVWNEGRSEQAPFLIEEDGSVQEPTSETPAKEQSSPLWEVATTVALFAAGFIAIWFLLQWVALQGVRVRLPIEW
jgi:proteasome lid subunit RPN8/RPN11